MCRIVHILSACGLVVLGLAIRWFGSSTGWLNNYGGGIVYVWFWSVTVLAVWPYARTGRVVGSVLGATCLVETMQLWHPPWLESIRASPFGSIFLGRTFDALDIVHYVVAAAIGYGALRWLEPSKEV
jgi:hypothetical protein